MYGSTGIVDFVLSQKSTLQRSTADNLDSPSPIRQKQCPVVGTVVNHMLRSGEGLRNWIIDIDLVMGTRPGKASGHQHRAIEHKSHGVIGTRNKHLGYQLR